MAKAVRALQGPWGVVNAVGAWPRLCGPGQSLEGVAKIVRARTRPGVAKDVGA